MGAVSLPVLKELYFTYRQQSFLNGRVLNVMDTHLGGSLVVANFSGMAGNSLQRTKQYELFGDINDSSRGCLRLGSASSSICFAAAGKVQVVYGLENEIWDVAAGLAIAAYAGCKVYFYRKIGCTKVDYIVGTPTATTQVYEKCLQAGITSLTPQSPV